MIIGLGQLGSFFRDVFVTLGREVVEVRRTDDLAALGDQHPTPEAVLVAVGEDDLAPLLVRLPDGWRSRAVLLQNELRPAQWLEPGLEEPTALIVWFERKAGRPPVAVRESIVSGPASALFELAFTHAGLPLRRVDSAELPFELALKNLYILVLNLCGLETRGSAGDLVENHAETFRRVFDDVLTLERAWFGPSASFDSSALESALRAAIARDPAHAASGRSAPRRLARALSQASAFAIRLPSLERLAALTST